MNPQISRLRTLGLLFSLLGGTLIVLGWVGTARLACVDCQLPYLLSGGAAGLGLIVIGASLLVIAQLRAEGEKLAERLTALATPPEEITAGATPPDPDDPPGTASGPDSAEPGLDAVHDTVATSTAGQEADTESIPLVGSDPGTTESRDSDITDTLIDRGPASPSQHDPR